MRPFPSAVLVLVDSCYCRCGSYEWESEWEYFGGGEGGSAGERQGRGWSS